MSALVTRPADLPDAAVFVHLVPDPLVDTEDEWQWLAGLEKSLTEAVSLASVGELEGVYLIGQEWVLCAHGPSVDPLWTAVSEVLARWPLPANSYVLRHGADGAPGRRVAIGREADSKPQPVGPAASTTWRPLSEQGVLAALALSSAA